MSPTIKIKKILIANRGEIAVRVIRSAKELNIKTVAVYSDADRIAPHVRMADEAVYLGASPSSQSYLQIDKIIEACKKLNVDAIHPGYGFLSENAVFAEKVEKAGIVFIGPPAEAIRVMGSKIEAKKAVAAYGVPLIPGTKQAITDLDEAKQTAEKIGYPVMLKASAGGGGKGMRIVEREEEFEEAMQRAVSEAESAFGDGAVFIEKYITSPKHIEFQVLGDIHGNIIHLFERDCSVQRRHQKVVEEAPSTILTEELRKEMGACAVNVARACGYYGAGTVEFIVDEQLNYYFLEMNTRLQVEHPITEQITGVDLVRQQIRVAEGKALSFKQEDLTISGHSIEVRVYAENPMNNFLPDIGTLQRYRLPGGGGVRVDGGYVQGMEIPIYYDPMISKLIVRAKTRKEAIAKMKRAIEGYKITGIETTLSFCKFVMEHESFVSGKYDTNFVKDYFSPSLLEVNNDEEAEKVAVALVAYLLNKESALQVNSANEVQKTKESNWKRRRFD